MFNQHALKSMSPNFYYRTKVMLTDCLLCYEGCAVAYCPPAAPFSALAGGTHLKYNINNN